MTAHASRLGLRMTDPLQRHPAAQPRPSAAVISIRELRSHCSTCSMRELCLPVGLGPEELEQIDSVIVERRKLAKGSALYRAGGPFTALYAVRVGSLKTIVLTEDGREQVAGYHMLGDIIGLDGIGNERHGCAAVALEDTEVCVMPFNDLETLARIVPSLQRNLTRFLAREVTRDHGVMLLLGSMRAEERLAAFLLNLSERYRQRGYSSVEFVLRMTREEIGSYIGLKLETVSRLFSRFQQEGLIQVKGRGVRLVDPVALRQLCGAR